MKPFLLFITLLAVSVSVNAQFWERRDSDFPTASTGVSRFSIVNENVAWGIGYNGINPNNNLQQFSRTTNAGATWDAGAFSVGDVNLGIGDISATSDQDAFIAVHPRAAGQQGGVWNTADAGATWSKSTTTEFTAGASFPNTIHFFDATSGVVMGDPISNEWEIYTTTDAGTSWSRVAAANIPAPESGETGYLAQKTFAGDSIWFTTSAGRIYHSTNRGASWSVYDSPISDFGGTSVSGDLSFSDSTKGIIQTNAGVLYTTTDSGASWAQITTSGAGSPYGDSIAYIPNSSSIVSVGSNPNFSGSSYSLDDGVTWINIDDIQHVDVAFFDAQTGLSGGFTANTDDRGIFVYAAAVLNNDDIAFAKANSLYPNPASNQVNIASTGNVLQVDLVNLSGQTLRSIKASTVIDLNGLSSGMYLVKVTTGNGTETLPLIKN